MTIESSLSPEESSVPQSFMTNSSDHSIELSSLRPWTHVANWVGAGVSLFLTVAAHSLWIRWEGYSGLSLFLVAATALIGIGVLFVHNKTDLREVSSQTQRTSRVIQFLLITALVISICVGCARLVWQGNLLLAVLLFVQVGVFAASLRGEVTEVWRIPQQWMYTIADGFLGWVGLPGVGVKLNDSKLLVWVIPIVIGVLFLVPLVSSHPDLVKETIRYANMIADHIVSFFTRSSFWEWFLCLTVAITTMGLLLSYPRAFVGRAVFSPAALSCEDSLYFMARNTLFVVIGVFAVFLSYEWYSLCFRVFPDGFYYAGFAHQGAAWLTTALAMSTVVLSVMFAKRVQAHPRVRLLRLLALVWSLLNLVLAIAVYNRLMIYVSFNGLTRMRIIGFMGVTCVVIGFLLVIRRVVVAKDWRWLIGRQMWAFAICVYLLTVIPIDWIAHQWNTRCILKNNLAPSVQISVHPISDEGLLTIMPLMQSESEILRDGIAALLADRKITLEKIVYDSGRNWKAFQGSEQLLFSRLKEHEAELSRFIESDNQRELAIKNFKEWAYQWY